MGKYSDVKLYPTTALAALVAQKNLEALAELLQVRLSDVMIKTAKKGFADLHLDEIEEYYSRFIERYFYRAQEPTEWCLAGVSADKNVEGFFYTSFRHFILDQLEKERRVPTSAGGDDSEGSESENIADTATASKSPYDPIEETGTEAKLRKELEIEILLETLEEELFSMNDMDQYTVVSHLIGKQFVGDSHPVKVPEGIASQFDLPTISVSRNIQKLMGQLKKAARKKRDKRFEE